MDARLKLRPPIPPGDEVQRRVSLPAGLFGALSAHTCAARVVAHGQGVSVVVGVHGEEADSEGAVLGVRRAIFKVLQVDAQLVVALNGQGVDLLQPCGRRQTMRERQEGQWQRSRGRGAAPTKISGGASPRPPSIAAARTRQLAYF